MIPSPPPILAIAPDPRLGVNFPSATMDSSGEWRLTGIVVNRSHEAVSFPKLLCVARRHDEVIVGAGDDYVKLYSLDGGDAVVLRLDLGTFYSWPARIECH